MIYFSLIKFSPLKVFTIPLRYTYTAVYIIPVNLYDNWSEN